MPREPKAYRENLQDVLEFFGGKRLLTLADVRAYTGLADNRSIKKRFPIKDGCISASTFAWVLSGGVA